MSAEDRGIAEHLAVSGPLPHTTTLNVRLGGTYPVARPEKPPLSPPRTICGDGKVVSVSVVTDKVFSETVRRGHLESFDLTCPAIFGPAEA